MLNEMAKTTNRGVSFVPDDLISGRAIRPALWILGDFALTQALNDVKESDLLRWAQKTASSHRAVKSLEVPEWTDGQALVAVLYNAKPQFFEGLQWTQLESLPPGSGLSQKPI